MVFMAMRDEYPTQLVFATDDVAEIGQDEVDTRMVFIWEHDSGIDDDHVVAVLEHGHVLADLIKPSKRDYAQEGLLMCHGVVCISSVRAA